VATEERSDMKRYAVGVCLSLLCSGTCAVEIPYQACFDLASQRHEVDLELLLAVAWVESNWDADARSKADAHGMMQIRWPQTARYLGARRVSELYNPCFNIDLGARYLRELSDRYGGDEHLVLAGYNYGPSRIRSRKDIPDAVMGYVDLVGIHRDRLSRGMDADAPAQLRGDGSIEVARFNRSWRAERFVATLRRQVPDARFSLSRNDRGDSIIHLHRAGLTVAARYRLAALLPLSES
jgi:hypothetical protein